MIGMIFLPFLFWIKLGRIFGGKKYLKKTQKKVKKGPFAPLQKEKNDTDDDALWSWCTPDDDDDDVVVVEEAEEDA